MNTTSPQWWELWPANTLSCSQRENSDYCYLKTIIFGNSKMMKPSEVIKNRNTLTGFGHQWSAAVMCLQLAEEPVSPTSLQKMSLEISGFPEGFIHRSCLQMEDISIQHTHAHQLSPSQVPADWLPRSFNDPPHTCCPLGVLPTSVSD